MIKRPRLIREFTKRVDEAVNAVSSRYETVIADEDDFTSRLLERIEAALDGWSHAGITLRVRKLTSKGPGTEEAEFGADIVATVNVDLEEYKADKGILVQSKRLDNKQFDPKEWTRMEGQIRKMNQHTDEAYVWIYSSSGVQSIKSATLKNLGTGMPDQLYTSKCATFLGEFVQSKHGDPRIKGFDRNSLTRIREEYNAQSAVSLSFRDEVSRD